MYYPNLTEFIKLSKKGNLIPVYKEILADKETPVSAFLKISEGEEGKYSYLLESIEGGEKWGEYSFLGNNPSKIVKYQNNILEIIENGKSKIINEQDPFNYFKKLMSNYNPVKINGLPRFYGGAVGYIGYEMVRFFEKLPAIKKDDLKIPDMFFVFTDTILIFDNLKHIIKIVSNTHIDSKKNIRENYKAALRKIDKISEKLKNPIPAKKNIKKHSSLNFVSNCTKNEFKRNVKISKDYITDGDIIQVQISQRLKAKIKSNPFDVYRALRIVNPSPYMYFLKFDKLNIAGSSPEILVRLEDKKVEIRPIAGTIKRGKNKDEDEVLQKELLSDPKEKAEHIMLVDLARNDLGRISEFNSVKVPELMVIEKYSHVMHIVSDVIGKLRNGLDQFDVLHATFPAGTVTGAPKIRAMEIIDELEKTKRGPYAGTVGYFGFSGNLDSAITIRTAVMKDGYAYIQAAAGIVADSNPEKEYNETLNKMKALVKAIEMAEGGLE
ncbi:MAG: anthranilate synthase component I [Elusimicrobia bacterium]|nr:anthranilate synthase component I [Elusimicrobiota bacterium]